MNRSTRPRPAVAGHPPRPTPAGAVDGRIFGLDLIRAGAVSLVLVAHASEALEPAFTAPLTFATLAVVGVELFFVLSGFLIGGIIIDTVRRDGRWLANFWVRRWLRTLPNYFLFLAVNVAIFRLGYRRWPAFGPFLYFGQALLSPHPQFFNEAWSLAIEEIFYLLAPLAAMALLPLARTRDHVLAMLTLAIVVIGSVRLGYVVGLNPDWDMGVRKVSLIRLDCIVYGVIAAYLCRRFVLGRAARQAIAAGGIALVGVASRLFVAGTVASNPAARALFFSMVPAGAAALLPLAAELDGASLPAAVTSATRRMALWSYSLYLTNLPVQRIMIASGIAPRTPAGGVVAFVGVIAAAIVWAAATYRWLERPVMATRDRVAARLGLTPAAAVVAPAKAPRRAGQAGR